MSQQEGGLSSYQGVDFLNELVLPTLWPEEEVLLDSCTICNVPSIDVSYRDPDNVVGGRVYSRKADGIVRIYTASPLVEGRDNDVLRMYSNDGLELINAEFTYKNHLFLKAWLVFTKYIDYLENNSVRGAKSSNILSFLVELRKFSCVTFWHSILVSYFAVELIYLSTEFTTEIMGGEGEDRFWEVYTACILHDCGKIKVNPDDLHSPSTDISVIKRVKSHVSFSDIVLNEIGVDNELITDACWDHHERYNGVGYPNKKIKDNISLIGRVLGVADSFDAVLATIVSDRAYRDGHDLDTTCAKLMGDGYDLPEDSNVCCNFGTLYDPSLEGPLTALTDLLK